MPDTSKLEHGIELFNSGRYFDAHEVLEDVWRDSHGADKRTLQGLVQLAVALHHHSTGNLTGARSVMARAAAKLDDAPDALLGLSLPPLRAAIRRWQAALAEGTPLPEPPRLHIARHGC